MLVKMFLCTFWIVRLNRKFGHLQYAEYIMNGCPLGVHCPQASKKQMVKRSTVAVNTAVKAPS